MKNWLNITLKLAAIYNIIWGAVVVTFPDLLFELAGMELPLYPMIWQSVGMIVGVYGIGYWVASRDYIRHWPVVLVGYLGKIFGPIGIFYQVAFLDFPKAFLVVTLFNDLIWLLPFTLMVVAAYKTHRFKI